MIIPGHGDVTGLATLAYFTVDYLTYMLKQVEYLLDESGELTGLLSCNEKPSDSRR